MYPFSFTHQSNVYFTYTFINSRGNTYRIIFSDAKDLFEFDTEITLKFYFINIISEYARPIYDLKTSKTIISIVNDFFDRLSSGFLFYYPENNDGREGSRSKVFDRWFNNNSSNNHKRILYDISFEETILEAGLIFLANNPSEDKAEKVVLSFITNLNQSKNNDPF